VTQRWLGLALYAEGATDHRFLDELLRRTVEHLLVHAGHAVDLSPVQRLPVETSPDEQTASPRVPSVFRERFICCSSIPTAPVIANAPDLSGFSRA
jgi:hypothetical protein